MHELFNNIPSGIKKSRVTQIRGIFSTVSSEQLSGIESIESLGSVRIGVVVCDLDITIGVQMAKNEEKAEILYYHSSVVCITQSRIWILDFTLLDPGF